LQIIAACKLYVSSCKYMTYILWSTHLHINLGSVVSASKLHPTCEAPWLDYITCVCCKLINFLKITSATVWTTDLKNIGFCALRFYQLFYVVIFFHLTCVHEYSNWAFEAFYQLYWLCSNDSVDIVSLGLAHP